MGLLSRTPALAIALFVLIALIALIGCGDALISYDAPASSIDPGAPRAPRFDDCLARLAKTDQHACLVIDELRTVLLFGLDTGQSCDPAIRLEADRIGKAVWMERELYVCANRGLTRLDLGTGARTVEEGETCISAIEGMRKQEDFVRFEVDPWPLDAVSVGGGRVYWSRGTTLRWAGLADPVDRDERGEQTLEGSRIDGLDLMDRGTLLALREDDGFVLDTLGTLGTLDREAGPPIARLHLLLDLDHPTLANCRPLP